MSCWRASIYDQGNPGTTDTVEFAGAAATLTESVDEGGAIRRETWRILEAPSPRRFLRLLVRQL